MGPPEGGRICLVVVCHKCMSVGQVRRVAWTGGEGGQEEMDGLASLGQLINLMRQTGSQTQPIPSTPLLQHLGPLLLPPSARVASTNRRRKGVMTLDG